MKKYFRANYQSYKNVFKGEYFDANEMIEIVQHPFFHRTLFLIFELRLLADLGTKIK